MNNWQAVIFDLDDTLFPESAYVLSGFEAVAKWAEHILYIPRETGFGSLKRLFSQGVRNNTFNVWLAEHHYLDSQFVDQAIEIYRSHTPSNLILYPDVSDALMMLRQQHLFLGIVSDGYLGVQQNKFNSLGLAHYFNAVVFSDELGRDNWKPSTEPFKLICARLAVEPKRAVYVGDNPAKDFIGARQIGLHTIQIKRSDTLYAQVLPPSPNHAPDQVIHSMLELERALKANCSIEP